MTAKTAMLAKEGTVGVTFEDFASFGYFAIVS
jgi:hypothetical protein